MMPYHVTLAMMEATGGIEIPVLLALHEAGHAVYRINPRWMKDFARAMGAVAKIDKLDAKIIALYGERMRPEPWMPPEPDAEALNAMCARRRQLLVILNAMVRQNVNWQERPTDDSSGMIAPQVT